MFVCLRGENTIRNKNSEIYTNNTVIYQRIVGHKKHTHSY